MSITIIPINTELSANLFLWTTADEIQLAELVAWIYVGYYWHAAKIVHRLHTVPARVQRSAATAAKSRLTFTSPEGRYHRDGLLFQSMSWLAARIGQSSMVLSNPPHLIPAHKGFDGFQLEIDGHAKHLSSIILFEDKATENPRSTIRDQIWPEIRKLEQGERQHEIIQAVGHLLEGIPSLDRDAVIQSIIWNEHQKYRVSVTVEPTLDTDLKRTRLFRGFPECVAGTSADRRQGNVCEITSLRHWMDQFAVLVDAAIDEIISNV